MNKSVLIDGAWSRGHGEPFQSVCPATREVVWSGQESDKAQVDAAVMAAQKALPDWSRRSLPERVCILERYADAIDRRIDKVAYAISRETGKVSWDAKSEVAAIKAKVPVSIQAQEERAGVRVKSTAFGASELVHRPHGVMGVFGPFNFPGHLPNGHIVPALLAGNTCVLKPSELTPSISELLVEAFHEAGLPDGCLNVVNGGRDTGAALLNADLNGILFTGSSSTGIMMHKHFAGRPNVILALEMGGNNPIIVWDPADVEAAADIVVQSAYISTGQRCSCARRLILPISKFGDDVLEAIVQRIDSVRIGAWNENEIFMGPLISESAAEHAVQHQKLLMSKGGKPLRSIKRLRRGTAFVTGGLMDVTGCDVPDEELFAPFIQVLRVETFSEAINFANDTKFGLAAGLVSEDEGLWQRARQDIRAGILNRNRPTAGASADLPFGGPGLSGNARPGAYYAADYSAWPQAGQISDRPERLKTVGILS